MPGLDPGIHEAAHRVTALRMPASRNSVMDGRVKPGHDVDGCGKAGEPARHCLKTGQF
jgi:hypothetical protein